MKIFQALNLNKSDLDDASQFFAGIECEIESVDSKRDFPFFQYTTDGSLRNDGAEFISVPLDKETLMSAFKNLHADIELYDPDVAFTNRTSTHVHINCRSLTEDNTRQLVLFYALFEEYFFAMVDKDRRHNIHCVPLTETFLPSIYKYPLLKAMTQWHKYTALNVLPLAKQGSIEFRHLQGTDNEVLLDEWLTTLDNLWRMCQREEINPTSLNNPIVVKQWWRTLFGHSPRIMALEPTLPSMTRNSMLDVKFAFI